MIPQLVVETPVEVVALRVNLPLLTPHLWAGGSETVRDVILVGWRLHDGTCGWGECPTLAVPGYVAEHTEGAWALLRSFGAGAVSDLVAGRGTVLDLHPMLVGALRDAALDASARRAGVGLARAGQEAGLATTTVMGTPASGSIVDLLAEVEAAVAMGAAAVKLKVQPGWDEDPLTAVRSQLPDIPLAVDANGSYATDPDAARALDRFGLLYIEQPLARTDLVGARRLAAATVSPIALDESIVAASTVDALGAMGATNLVISIKPARLGGMAAAAATLEAAERAGYATFVGGMLETGIGRAAAVAVASWPGVDLPTDLGPSSRYFEVDLCEPLELSEGLLQVPSGPGIGREPDPARLAEVTVDSLSLDPSAWADVNARVRG